MAIRSSDTHYFVDPSIAVAALELGPDDLIGDLNTMGLLFETMAVRDLRCYADALSGTMYHYRDKSGLECDAVMHLRGGRYGLIEVKLGGSTGIEEGAATLKALADRIDTDKMKRDFETPYTFDGRPWYKVENTTAQMPREMLRKV